VKKILILLALVFFATPAAAVDIKNCFGGSPVKYGFQYRNQAATGEMARVVGHAQSSCTMFFGYFSKDKICVGPGAKLGFHQGVTVGVTGMMLATYPAEIRAWIDARGGLKDTWHWMYAKDLWAMGYKRC
jgi:hypothetical protein